MLQSHLKPLHVAIVMDGNGRWALRQGLPRVAGHRAGARAVRPIIEAAPGLTVGTLTLFAFSSDNWRRPMPEVVALLRLFRRHLETETERCVAEGVALSVIGRRDRLPVPLLRAIAEAESRTAGGTTLRLRIAIDYSAQDALLRAAARFAAEGAVECSLEEFGRYVAEVDHGIGAAPPVDIFLRTGGERRLSDFLLWESAYAELFFREEMWPDFRPADLAAVLAEFRRRERRFGGLEPVEARPSRNPLIKVISPARSSIG